MRSRADLDSELITITLQLIEKQTTWKRLWMSIWPWPKTAAMAALILQRNRLAAELDEYDKAAAKAGFRFGDVER
jgi:uncharacterized membrane protein